MSLNRNDVEFKYFLMKFSAFFVKSSFIKIVTYGSAISGKKAFFEISNSKECIITVRLSRSSGSIS